VDNVYAEKAAPLLTAANIARGCTGRNRPLLIFDLAASTSVEELVGLLPTVCLYTPEDIRRILGKTIAKAS
jgi:glutamyl-tRNA reductase